MKALVLVEHDNQSIRPSTLSTITAAGKVTSDIDLLVAGNNCETVAQHAAQISGVSTIHVVSTPALEHFLAEAVCDALLSVKENYTHFLAPASTFGKNIMPRLAAKLDVMQISDLTAIMDHETFERPIYAGNAIATYKSSDPIKVLTIRTTAFDPTESQGGSAEIKTHPGDITNLNSNFVGIEASNSGRPDLTSAEVVISGGRALQSQENFKLIEDLADTLNAAVGASRAAVDAGYVPNDYQVGQTGKIVAPKLYIAIGISGAIQHLAGMKDSKVIVAINKDPDAPIFQIADYGLVGDLFQIVPELIEAIQSKRAAA